MAETGLWHHGTECHISHKIKSTFSLDHLASPDSLKRDRLNLSYFICSLSFLTLLLLLGFPFEK